LAPFVSALNAPLLRPLRRIIPTLGGLDLSVLVALVMLRVALHLMAGALATLA
jgi:YggT family protein